MCFGGSNKTTSTMTLPPEFRQAYTNALGMAGQAINQPYQAYQGQLVAGLNPSQQQAISNIGAAQGMALPAISEGMDYTRMAARGITPELYNRFYSPYVRDVANATQANLLESAAQQQAGLKGGAIQAGAFGGDRAGIAQAEMARQQQLANAQAMSGIYNQGYGQAMGLAGQQVQNYGTMGQQLAGLGVGAQGAALQGAQAQMAAGAQQQATEQAQLQAAYEQFMQRLAYPYQQAQFYSNIAQGLGGTAGGTTTSTQPAPSMFSQIMGGIGAIGSIFKDGGAVKSERNAYAEGGVAGVPYAGHQGWIPDGKLGGSGNSIPKPTPLQDQSLDESWGGIKPFSSDQVKGIYNVAHIVGIPLPGSELYARGGLARAHYATDGAVDGLPSPQDVEAYIVSAAKERGIDPEVALKVYRAEGATGDPAEGWQSKIVRKDGTREPSYGPFQLYTEGGLGNEMQEKTGLDPADPQNWKPGVDFSLDTAKERGWSPWMGAKAAGLDPRAGLDGGVRVVPVGDDAPAGLAAADMPSDQPKGIGGLFASENNPNMIEKLMGRRMSPEARNAVLNASFALMAGRSPFFFTNVGEAGKVGMNTYYAGLANQRELAKQQTELGLRKYEADTGRQTVEVSERNARRQQAALILPIVQTLLATNQPIPPYIAQMLNDAFPEGSPEREKMLEDVNKRKQSINGIAGDTAPLGVPAVPAVDAPAATGSSTAPSSDADTEAEVNPVEDQLQSIYSNLPDALNPYYWDNRATMADRAGKPDLADKYREKAQIIRDKDYDKGYWNINGKRVEYPYKQEQIAQNEITKAQAGLDVTSTNEQDTRAQDNIRTFQTAQNTLEQAAEALSKTSTGQLEDTKAYLVSVLNSLGLEQDAKRINQAVGIEKLSKEFSQILFNGGLKDKIGSDIAARELDMFSKGFGDVNLLPSTNRFIVGTMRGLLEMESQRARDWIDFRQENTKPMSRREIAAWEKAWNDDPAHKVQNFVGNGIAKTPVKDEINWKQWASDPNYQRIVNENLKVGYQYVMPDGKVKVYTGRREDKYFVPVGGGQ